MDKPAPPPSRTKTVWLLIGICCLGLIGFLIAGTIILALIPVYLPPKDVTTAAVPNDNDTFYLQYSANADVNDSVTGSLENTDEIANILGFGSDAEVSEAYTQGTFVRRKRDLNNQRRKRQIMLNILIIGKYNFPKTCTIGTCQTTLRTKVQQRIEQLGDITNFPCSVLSAGVLQRFTISVTFVGFIPANGARIGFGAVNSLAFVATQNGSFNDPLTWSGGIVPFGECSVLISSGITVTLPRVNLEIPMQTCNIYGTLAVGSGSSAFTFNYAVNLIVCSGGLVQFLTSNTLLLIPPLSVVTLYSGGSFSATGVVIQTYTSAGVGNSTTLTNASGPFTCGVLSGGTLLSFNRVTFIIGQSGAFTSGSTYLGGIAPTADSCTGGCGLYIPSGYTLTTGDLNGVLNMRFDEIDVSSGAIVQLDTSGSSAGFRFQYSVHVKVYGTLEIVGTSGAGIYIPTSSSGSFYAGAIYSSEIATFIEVYDPTTGDNVVSRIVLLTYFNGIFSINISSNGTISVNVTSLGQSATTTITPAVTNVSG